jgi:hypothetical protein
MPGAVWNKPNSHCTKDGWTCRLFEQEMLRRACSQCATPVIFQGFGESESLIEVYGASKIRNADADVIDGLDVFIHDNLGGYRRAYLGICL